MEVLLMSHPNQTASDVRKWQQSEQTQAAFQKVGEAMRETGRRIAEDMNKLTEGSKHGSYEAGKQARATGKDIKAFAVNGWGYPKSRYYGWFQLGFYGDDFRADLSTPAEMSYGERKARSLIAQAYRDIGRHSKAESILKPEYQSMGLKAFAAYIESVE